LNHRTQIAGPQPLALLDGQRGPADRGPQGFGPVVALTASFLPGVVDRMVSVPDAASIAAARHVSAVLGRRVGPSTGTNLWGAFGLLAEMVADGRSGSVVTLLADSGDRYADTYLGDEWVSAQGLDPSGPAEALVEFERSRAWG
jgi:cysteine synthase